MKRRKYQVHTWDWESHEWTPQKGVKRGPYTLFGLRKAIRRLRGMGYEGGRGDVSMLVSDYKDEVNP